MKQFDANFELRNELFVEPAETNEGSKSALTLREWPTVDEGVL